MSNSTPHRPVLYVIGCASPSVLEIHPLLTGAMDRGWDTCLILTPTAARWLASDLATLSEITGHPVRSTYKMPGEPDLLPEPDAMVVAPATSNTINKWAAGISDTLALGLITEAIGKQLLLVALPVLTKEQAVHPAFPRSISTLQEAGVTLLSSEASDTESRWRMVLDTLSQPPQRRL